MCFTNNGEPCAMYSYIIANDLSKGLVPNSDRVVERPSPVQQKGLEQAPAWRMVMVC